ncbi:MAG: PaaI family thioesterase [Actinobacteria bacterium]|nr:PaaI family thioesterase [Actinomycetota bacterium]
MPFDIDMEWFLEPPGLVAVFTPGPQHHGPANSLHGGIAALVLDECMAAYGNAVDKVHTITGTLNLKYRKPIPLDGRPLRVAAWREGELRRVNKVSGALFNADGEIAVEASGLFIRAWDGAYPAKKKS